MLKLNTPSLRTLSTSKIVENLKLIYKKKLHNVITMPSTRFILRCTIKTIGSRVKTLERYDFKEQHSRNDYLPYMCK